MLLQIRDFIISSQIVSTQQLAREFRIDEYALQPMLDIWLRKGVIEPCHSKAGCQSACNKCSLNSPLFYQIKRI